MGDGDSQRVFCVGNSSHAIPDPARTHTVAHTHHTTNANAHDTRCKQRTHHAGEEAGPLAVLADDGAQVRHKEGVLFRWSNCENVDRSIGRLVGWSIDWFVYWGNRIRSKSNR